MADGQEQRKWTDRERQVQNVNDFTGGADHAAGLQAGKTADGNTDYTNYYCLYADGKETGHAVKLVYICKN